MLKDFKVTHKPIVDPNSVRFSNGMTVKLKSATRGHTFQPACIIGQKSFCTCPKTPALSWPRNAASAAIYPTVFAVAPID